MLAQTTLPPHPRRFMEAPQRNRRLGRPLRVLTKTARPDPQLIDLIGQRLMHRDEVGAALVAAMQIADADDPDRVTMGQFKPALEYGADAVSDCPRLCATSSPSSNGSRTGWTSISSTKEPRPTAGWAPMPRT